MSYSVTRIPTFNRHGAFACTWRRLRFAPWCVHLISICSNSSFGRANGDVHVSPSNNRRFYNFWSAPLRRICLSLRHQGCRTMHWACRCAFRGLLKSFLRSLGSHFSRNRLHTYPSQLRFLEADDHRQPATPSPFAPSNSGPQSRTGSPYPVTMNRNSSSLRRVVLSIGVTKQVVEQNTACRAQSRP